MAAHFSPASLKFLRGLARHNDREWFEPRKPVYEAELKTPMLALIDQINQALLDFAPEYVRPAHKCMMRIYRDVRFSADKRPYKRQIAAWWSRQGLEKTSGGGFYFQLSADAVQIAAGVYMPEKEQLAAIRHMLLERHAEYRALLKSPRLRTAGFEPIDAMKMARGPKGFPANHVATDLVMQRQWGVSSTLPVEAALAPTLRAEIVKRFRAAAPLVSLLNSALVEKPKRAMF